MVYKKIQNEEGNFMDVHGRRWDVLEAHEAHTPQGMNVGWDEYPDLQTALTAYGLFYDPQEQTI